MKILLSIVCVLFCFSVCAEEQFDITTETTRLKPLLDAIKMAESGGEQNPDQAVGDNGASLGAFQITKPYWQDAVENSPWHREKGYVFCVTNQEIAREIVVLYWYRYNKNTFGTNKESWEFLCRMHNGGPNGHNKNSTIKYWNKVNSFLESRK